MSESEPKPEPPQLPPTDYTSQWLLIIVVLCGILAGWLFMEMFGEAVIDFIHP